MTPSVTAAEYCRRVLVELDQVINLPGMSVDNRALLELHRIQVQDALHNQGVTA